MIRPVLLCCLLTAYLVLLTPFAEQQKSRPIEVKLGYLPHSQILRVVSGEHSSTLGGFIVMRVLFYYGTVLQKLQEQVIISPEFFNMFRTIQTVVDLDPYNMDAYYFAQASFTWELGRVHEVNTLLERGAATRHWDPFLPFYLGFNHAYFLKDYNRAATYMQEAAVLSGNPFFARLATRFYYESEQSGLGLAFLETMIKTAKDQTVRKSYQLRRDALLATVLIEKARDQYLSRFSALPQSPKQLVDAGLLEAIPKDPYGGTFYLDQQGRVRTTSKLVSLDEKSMKQ